MKSPVLRALDLEVGHDRTRAILSNVSFELWQGELTALIGPNGSGKSTLLRSLAGLLPLKQGTVERQDVAFVPTGLGTVPGLMAKEVVSLGRLPSLGIFSLRSVEDRREVERALRDVGALDLADRFFDELSDGQKKKILLARALAQGTPLMILDEPCAFLDAPQRLGLYSLLSRLCRDRNMAILLSSHHWDAVLACVHQTLLLQEGRALWGAPEDFILRGDLDKFKMPDGVVFDPRDGRFKYSRELKEEIPQIDWKAHFARKVGLDVSKFNFNEGQTLAQNLRSFRV